MLSSSQHPCRPTIPSSRTSRSGIAAASTLRLARGQTAACLRCAGAASASLHAARTTAHCNGLLCSARTSWLLPTSRGRSIVVPFCVPFIQPAETPVPSPRLRIGRTGTLSGDCYFRLFGLRPGRLGGWSPLLMLYSSIITPVLAKIKRKRKLLFRISRLQGKKCDME